MVTYTYDAWGKLLSIDGSLKDTLGTLNPLTYRGYVYDTETEFYYLQSRYYNPTASRFLNADAFASTGQGILGNNMFSYCRNNPVSRKDASGTEDVCVEDFNEDNNPLNDIGNPTGSSGCGVSGVCSSYYVRQNVIEYDSWWQNSCYNPNMTWSNGATNHYDTQADAFTSFVEDPKSIKGKTAKDMSKALGESWKQGKYGSQKNGWKFNNGDRMVAYHPGGGRHRGSYYVLSSASVGRIKFVGSDYIATPDDKAMIIWDN